MELENNNVSDIDNEELTEQSERDELAEEFAAKLNDTDADFEPQPELTAEQKEEQEQAALDEVKKLAEDKEGAKMLAAGAVSSIEAGLQNFGHDKFVMPDAQKEKGVEALTPMIHKYAPNLIEMFGRWKDEIKATYWTATFSFGAVKQLKRLKAEDAAAAKAKANTTEQKEAA